MTTNAPAPIVTRQSLADRTRQLIPLITLVLMYVATVAIAPGYLEPQQIGSLLQLSSILGVAAIGQTLVILVGGIDLSVGAVMTLSNLIAATIMAGRDSSLAAAVVTVLLIGAVIGLVNGLIIRCLGVPDLVATLATMTATMGIGLLYTKGSPKGSSAPALVSLVTTRFAGVFTGSVIVWLFLAIITIVLLKRTRYGRFIYAVGLNREASRYSAVPVNATIMSLYLTSGVTAALGGLLLTGYTGSSYLGSGDSYQMQTIAAVILGGTSMFGGRGGYGGTMIGCVITVLLVSVLRVVGILDAGQSIAYGAIILLMLILFTKSSKGKQP